MDEDRDEVIISLNSKVTDDVVCYLKDIGFYSNPRIQIKRKGTPRNAAELKERLMSVLAMAGR